jgi:D-alanine-D-alanine ligase
MSKKILAFHGVRVPDFTVFHAGESFVRPSALRYPLIVKPLLEDASVGIAQSSVVSDDEGLAERTRFIHEKFSQAAIAEELIEGRELYVGLIGNGELEMLPVIEMDFGKLDTAERRIATWKAKWDEEYRKQQRIRTGFARKLTPEMLEKLRQVSDAAFHALGFHDYGRLDLRLTHDDELYVLEANPNPFIAREHEMAMAAEKAGMSYPDFIERIVREAIKRHDQHE